MSLMEEATVDLSPKRQAALRPVEPDARLTRPRTVHHWLIPSAVILSAALCAVAALQLAGHATDPDPTGWTVIAITVAVAAAATTVVYVQVYLLRQSMHRDHKVLLDEILDVRAWVSESRARMVVADSEQRALLERVSGKVSHLSDAQWMAFAEEARRELGGDGAAVLPFGRGRRPGA